MFKDNIIIFVTVSTALRKQVQTEARAQPGPNISQTTKYMIGLVLHFFTIYKMAFTVQVFIRFVPTPNYILARSWLTGEIIQGHFREAVSHIHI